jgi:hypothetical protein
MILLLCRVCEEVEIDNVDSLVRRQKRLEGGAKSLASVFRPQSKRYSLGGDRMSGQIDHF